RLSTSVKRRLRIAHRDRRPIGVALQSEEAARRFDGDVRRWRGRIGARLAVRGDRDVDDPGVAFADLFVSKTEMMHDSWIEALDEDIGAVQQWIEGGAIAGVLQVDHDALLARADGRPVERFVHVASE